MTPAEARWEYLIVGRDRRLDGGEAGWSRGRKRQVMGRKGIGKLAPFGICKQIEVLSAGGEKTDSGYVLSHFTMDYDEIINATQSAVPLEVGGQDGQYAPTTGTTVTLHGFRPKVVPNRETFYRQLARRFRNNIDFDILIEDTRHNEGAFEPLPPFEIEINVDTLIDFTGMSLEADDRQLPIGGWIAKARGSYSNEEDPGVRIYARDKIVDTTRDFGQPAGFTGEFVMRSYLVGEIYADWLDEDDGEDLIRTDRQGIIWDSDYGKALSEFGRHQIRILASSAYERRRRDARHSFLEISQIENLARGMYNQEDVVKAAIDMASIIGDMTTEEELALGILVEEITEIILYMAPHKVLMDAFREFSDAVGSTLGQRLDSLEALFGKISAAEIASYGQLVHERVEVIGSLRSVLNDARVERIEESRLQKMIKDAPWLIRPDWTLITSNQPLKSFEASYREEVASQLDARFPEDYERKRPDFIMIEVGGWLHCIEIKAPRHTLDNADFERLYCYVLAFNALQERSHDEVSSWNGCTFHAVADDVGISDEFKLATYNSLVRDGTLVQYSWDTVLRRAEVAHGSFLKIRELAETTDLEGPDA